MLMNTLNQLETIGSIRTSAVTALATATALLISKFSAAFVPVWYQVHNAGAGSVRVGSGNAVVANAGLVVPTGTSSPLLPSTSPPSSAPSVSTSPRCGAR